MRNDFPVTDREVVFGQDEVIISTTDLRGRITSANETFCRIAGYTQDELVGQPHHIVRHPDMPPAAFKDLWDTLKAGKPWCGLVKNRAKNGDYYWVNGNASPIKDDRGQVSGYISIRTKPERAAVEACSALYKTLMNAKRVGGRIWSFSAKIKLLALVQAIAVLGLLALGQWGNSQIEDGLRIAMAAAGLTTLGFQLWTQARFLKRISRIKDGMLRVQGRGDMCTQIPVGINDEAGELERGFNAMVGSFRAIVLAVRNDGQALKTSTQELVTISQSVQQASYRQNEETQTCAATVDEVASAAASIADKAQEMNALADDSLTKSQQGRDSVRHIEDKLDQIERAMAVVVNSVDEFGCHARQDRKSVV